MVILQKRVAGLNESSFDRFVTRAKRAAGVRGAVTVLVTSNEELRRLNHRFRGLNKATDVLSFPAPTVMTAKFAGDVAISAQIAAQNARRLGHSLAEEVKILCLHGLLHLAGYDHERDNGRMARREERLRIRLGLPIALIERTTVKTGKILNRRARGVLRQSARREPTAGGRNNLATRGVRDQSVRARRSLGGFSAARSRRAAR